MSALESDLFEPITVGGVSSTTIKGGTSKTIVITFLHYPRVSSNFSNDTFLLYVLVILSFKITVTCIFLTTEKFSSKYIV